MLSWRLYQVLLFILPLPFAGLPGWGWGIFSALAFASMGAHLYQYISPAKRQPSVPTSFKKSLPVIVALVMVQLIVLFQYLLPWLFKASAPHENYLVLVQGFSLVIFFALTVLHLNSRIRAQRAIWPRPPARLLIVITWPGTLRCLWHWALDFYSRLLLAIQVTGDKSCASLLRCFLVLK
jgi:hypothetical protein